MKPRSLTTLLGLLMALAPGAAIAQNSCVDLFAKPSLAVPAANLAAQLRAKYDSPNVEALQALVALKKAWPGLRKEKQLLNAIASLLKDEEASVSHIALEKLLVATIKEPASMEKLIANLKSQLELVMTPAEAAARAELLKSSQLNSNDLQRALGAMTLSETVRSLLGSGDLRKIDPDSLVGRFIEASRADRNGALIKTVVTRFRKDPEADAKGEERLYISVDDRNIKLAQKFFGDNANLLIHNHEDNQGTLELHHMGEAVSYARYLRQFPLGGGSVGTVLPIIALSTQEASATYNYFTLGTLTNKARAKYPWSLKDDEGNSYCRPGGYTTCTHWFGEMPIGELRTNEYSFPGIADEHADQKDPSAKSQRSIRTGAIGTYTKFQLSDRVETIGTETRIDRLTRMVWQEKQGHQQMWQVLRAKAALRKGELANPGWVLYTLLGTAPQKRVPIVLVHRENATKPFTKPEVARLEESVDAY